MQMMGVSTRGETTMTPEDFNWAREHFIDYVRASGPLPTLRVGKQPYGVLPVTSLNLFTPKSESEDEHSSRQEAVRDFLVKLRELWRRNLSQVPRVGRSENPDQDMADIFSMDGVSSNYGMRHLMGEMYLRSLWSSMLAGDTNAWWARQQELTKASLNALGLNWNPRLSRATYSGWYVPLKGPLTQAEPILEDAPLANNFIELLLGASDLDTLRNETFPDPKPRSLLYFLLRHGLLLEYWAAAVNLSLPAQILASGIASSQEQEIVSAGGAVPTAWEVLNKSIAGVTDGPVWQFLFSLDSTPSDTVIASRVSRLLEFRESLDHLKSLGAGKLQRHFAGTLDLCSHRLDAWITSLATKRLEEIREASPTGILIGGYGWVMNLKPSAPPVMETPPAGEEGVLLRPANNPGYTHTPSLAQAATVAVLRSGHLTHSDSNTKDLLAIDLSSERVRLAAWLLDGVRQGQPLGALLGYRFERRLQEARLGQFIPYFREVAPLVANKLKHEEDQAAGESAESIAANNVVDGLELQRKWKSLFERPAPRLFPVQLLFSQIKKKPDMGQLLEARLALEAELNLLDDSVDAVSDALLAESVHHAVQGNPLRTASTLDAIASGEAPPPELEVARTPRTGVALTYRLVTLFDSASVLPPEWKTTEVSHRANAEPRLNVWAAKLLGNPSAVRCLIEQLDPSTGAVIETREMGLSELGLSPLDFIYAAEGNRDAQPSEIEQRILYMMRSKAEGFAANAILRINPRRGEGWAASDVSYGEFAELLRAARKLITGARGLDASELDLPEENQSASVDLIELQTRADNADQEFARTKADLQTIIDNADADLESLRDVILSSAQFGISGSVPFASGGDANADRQSLLLQAGSIARELAQRSDQLAALKASVQSDTATDDEKLKQQIDRLHIIFGNSFVVMPQFSAGNATELEKALADSTKVQDNDPLAVVTWFQRANRVREGVARLDASMRYAEALETGERLSLRIAQLPYAENNRWTGLPLKPGQGLSPSRFSLIVQSVPTLDVKQPLAGLLIDEWVEVVPNVSETTGIVFQYDQPDATPPQCILLAVSPFLDLPWNIWSLQQVLLETLDLARIRAVDPDALDEVGHYLPALYFAVNAAGETVSTDFSKLK